MTYFMGIDGGGTSVRTVIVGRDLQVFAQGSGGNANPNSVGREAAAQSIRSAMHAALTDVKLDADQIIGVGVGVAGTRTCSAWLSNIIRDTLPLAKQYISTDYEIALVGAHGKKEGAILIAGTGSIAYGINAAGESRRVGGWGWLLGDEGSGYWIGKMALRALVRSADGRASFTILTDEILSALSMDEVEQLIDWAYNRASIADIARLAPLVLSHSIDPAAHDILEKATQELAHAASTVIHTLKMTEAQIKFAGGLLTGSNPLSDKLTAKLGLAEMPISLYPPSIGAAILGISAGTASNAAKG
jgi:N-acetylglucosamine kinase-like BadF-type ATPase